MPITAFLKIPNIPGESRSVDHEDEIDVHGVHWGVARKNKAAKSGRGRARSRAVASPLEVHKFYDAASPYLALSTLQGKAFDEIVLSVRRDSGEAPLDYLVITMTNCTLKSYDMFNDGVDDPLLEISERVSITFEQVNIKYTVQADDHSAGDEHEIEYDVAAGV